MKDQLPDERPTRRREYSGAASTLGIAALIVIVVGLSLWFFQFRDSGGGHAEGVGGIIDLPKALNPTAESPAARDGRAAPDFELASVDGSGMVKLDALQGNYVLINFWASWCAPCRSETPELQQLYEKARQGKKPLVIVGVNQQETRSAAEGFAKQFSVTYPLVLDSSGEVSQAYHVDRGLPHSFLVSPAGVIEQIYLGEMTSADFSAIETQVLS